MGGSAGGCRFSIEIILNFKSRIVFHKSQMFIINDFDL